MSRDHLYLYSGWGPTTRVGLAAFEEHLGLTS
jgi:hypothetical protein